MALSLSAAAPAEAQAGPATTPGMTLTLQGHHQLGAQKVAVLGQTIRLRGVVAPYAPGQVVTLRATIARRPVLLVRRTVTPGAGGNGEFHADLRVSRIGAIHATATSPQSRLAEDYPVVFSFVPAAGRGARGLRVRFLQSRLALLGYATNRTGVYDAATARAVLAYRKVNGMARRGGATRAIFGRLALRRGRYVASYPSHGRHVEADLGRQVLALINPGGRVYRVYIMSSGKPSTPTVRGSYRVYRKEPGTNSLGMVHSNYFIGGYALHGYKSVPTYPASAGCLRLPIANAAFVNRWVRIGTRVDTFYRGRRAPARQRVTPRPGP